MAISSLVAPTIVTERVSCKLQGPTRELEKSTVIQLYNFMLIALNSNSTLSVVFAYKLISRLCFTSTRDKFEEEKKMGSIIPGLPRPIGPHRKSDLFHQVTWATLGTWANEYLGVG